MNIDIANIINDYGIFNTLGIAGLVIYLLPIVVNCILSIFKSFIAFALRLKFFEKIERTIKNYVNSCISSLLHSDDVTTNDIPHLESDYLFLYRINICKDNLNIEIPTIEIRIRFWRWFWLVALKCLKYKLTFWRPLGERKQELDKNLQRICSREIKEVKLENAYIVYKADEIKSKAVSVEDTKAVLETVLQEKLPLEELNFHILLERATLVIKLQEEEFYVENINGHLHNTDGYLKAYVFGFHEGQIVSFSNRKGSYRNYQAIITSISLNHGFWKIITSYIPALSGLTTDNSAICKLTDVHCFFSLEEGIQLESLEWRVRDGEVRADLKGRRYSLSAFEGSFSINELKHFAIRKLNCKLNNHPLGFGGYVDFSEPLKGKEQLATNSGTYSFALDSNALTFINDLHIELLNRFWLEGCFNISSEALTLAFKSKQTENSALKVAYKDFSAMLKRFDGSIKLSGSEIVSDNISCSVISAYNTREKMAEAKLLVNRFVFNMANQKFYVEAGLEGLETMVVYTESNFHGCIDINLIISGYLVQENSISVQGNYVINDISYGSGVLDSLMPEKLAGEILLDAKGIRANAVMNDKYELPCALEGGRMKFKAPAPLNKVKDKLEQIKSKIKLLK